jgi:hypothetical protein
MEGQGILYLGAYQFNVMTDKELLLISQSTVHSFSEISEIHEFLPPGHKTIEAILEISRILLSRAISLSEFAETVRRTDSNAEVYYGRPLWWILVKGFMSNTGIASKNESDFANANLSASKRGGYTPKNN